MGTFRSIFECLLCNAENFTLVPVVVCEFISLLVHLDDNFIRHFANESTFIIDITATPRNSAANTSSAADNDDEDDDEDGFDVTLTEIDVNSNTAVTQS